MKTTRLLIIIFQLCFVLGCQEEPPNEIEPFQCSYFELKNQEIELKSEGGNFIKGDIKFVIEGNIKKLGNTEFETSLSDSSIVNYNSKTERYFTNYKTGFISKHNSIIQILCAIDKDLQDTTLSIENRNLLFKEKIIRRAEYFELLLGKEDDKKAEQKKLAVKKNNDYKYKEIVGKTTDLSVQLPEQTNGFKSIFFRNKEIIPFQTSTKYNPRFSIVAQNNTNYKILIIANNGDTCKVNYSSSVEGIALRLIPYCF